MTKRIHFAHYFSFSEWDHMRSAIDNKDRPLQSRLLGIKKLIEIATENWVNDKYNSIMWYRRLLDAEQLREAWQFELIIDVYSCPL